jgi:hypothetical protein
LSENEADRLRAHLAHIQPGQITDTTDLERLLAACWDELTGDYGGMEGYKQGAVVAISEGGNT